VVDNSETPPHAWTTYAERLEAAGIDWRVHQQVNNYDDNALAWFKRFQQAPKSSPLYRCGMAVQNILVDRFAEDVATDRLPQTSGEYVNPVPSAAHGISGPIGLGFRVPMIIISPWTTGGYACGDTFDHTSTIRFMERVFGVREPNIKGAEHQSLAPHHVRRPRCVGVRLLPAP
jgi:phospholipase C